MKSNKAKAMILGVSLAALLLVGLGSTTAQAQRRVGVRPRTVFVTRPYWGYRSFWGPRWGWGWNDPFWSPTVRVVDPIAQAKESGYHDGHSRGKDDAKHGKADAPESHKHFRDSDSQTYRQAFLQGYADGYHEKMAELRTRAEHNAR
jgi:hypothetical protein